MATSSIHHIVGAREGVIAHRMENPFENRTENLPYLVKETNIQVQEAQRVPQQDDSKEAYTKTHP